MFEPTGTTHGGTGFYVKSNLVFKVRKELNLNSPGNFEAMFIEIILPDRKNLIIGCIYRHGSGIPLRDFTNDHLEPILEIISNENKECMLMGDFNVMITIPPAIFLTCSHPISFHHLCYSQHD